MATKQELMQEYKTLAKKADARLRSLENAAKTREGFKPATQWAYQSAMQDIQHRFGEGANRFNRVLPEKVSRAGIQAAINETKRFLESPTSSVRGIIKTYKQRADTINARYGTDFKWQELAQFFDSGTFDKLNSRYGSDMVFILIADRQKDPEKVIKEIQKSNEQGKKLPNEDVNEEIYQQLLNENLTQEDLQKFRRKVTYAQTRRKRAKQHRKK